MANKAQAFHSALWQVIENLGTRCGQSDGPVDPDDMCPMCEQCDIDYSAATKALFAVIYIHRPDGMAEPQIGDKVDCPHCEAEYPCRTLRAVADDLGLVWDEFQSEEGAVQ